MWIQIGSGMMFAGVAIGAFGAHALRDKLSPYGMDIYKTAVLYHFIHALAIFIVAWLNSIQRTGKVTAAGFCFVAGIILFSGSLYLLAITDIKRLGAITPLGGLAFLAGWGLLAFSRT